MQFIEIINLNRENGGNRSFYKAIKLKLNYFCSFLWLLIEDLFRKRPCGRGEERFDLEYFAWTRFGPNYNNILAKTSVITWLKRINHNSMLLLIETQQQPRKGHFK